ncbi:hypothetical protein [Streptomyces zagrosensis]|uniref:Secreted protein n=1 Tax=Streptomyces zagrosensis TaxID=1042984 RepID=A0A7W9QFJ8_9ACTN|nr:hypothetical protein [Streptomyces zagrosensis]MBB5938092.1 hypothetical protein [Streptomyces zagrosensis]
MKSVITSRMKTAALAGLTAALLIAGAANVSSSGDAGHASNGEEYELSLANKAAQRLPAPQAGEVRVLDGSGRASERTGASVSHAITPGQRLIVDTVCLGAGTVNVTATAGGSQESRRVRCTESEGGASRLTLTAHGAGDVRVAIEPDDDAAGGMAFCARKPA